MRALGTTDFAISIVPEPSKFVDKTLPRPFVRGATYLELEQLVVVAELRKLNARGRHIFIKPEGDHGLVVIDDLSEAAIAQMRADGFAPAAVVQSSWEKFQAWIKLAARPLAVAVRAAATLELTQRYGGDLRAVSGDRFGRAPGTTNPKPEHVRDGLGPFVLAHDCSGEVAPAGADLITRLEAELATIDQDALRAKQILALQMAKPTNAVGDAGVEYQRVAQQLIARFGDQVDLSKVDWQASMRLAKIGFPVTEIARAIRDHSPSLDDRKVDADSYAQHTAEKAWMQAHADLVDLVDNDQDNIDDERGPSN